MVFAKSKTKKIFIFLFLSQALTFVTAQNSKVFCLSPQVDVPIIAAGLSVNALSYIFREDYDSWQGNKANKDDVNAFDRHFIKEYNWHLDKTGDVAVGLCACLPILPLAMSPVHWKETIVMYAESALFAHGTKELIKSITERKRPYMYTNNVDASATTENDYKDSFLSGHSTMAFNGAAFASYVFCKTNQDSKLKLPFVITSFSFATGTAILRIASGNHFLSDTLAGAALGTFSGVFVPWLHTLKTKNKNNVVLQGFNLLPNGVSYTYKM